MSTRSPRGIRRHCADPNVLILTVHHSHPEDVCFLAPFGGAYFHWLGDDSKPCTDDGRCLYCPGKRQWKGFAPGRVWVPEVGGWKRAIVEVTLGLAWKLGEDQLRGSVYRLARAYASQRAPVIAKYLGTAPEGVCDAAFPIEERLASIFNVAALSLDIAPPPEIRLDAALVTAPPVQTTKPQLAQHTSQPEANSDRAQTRKQIDQLKATGQWLGSDPKKSADGKSTV